MRLLLFIPVLVLFLSNVPIIQRIPVEKAMAMMERDETCGKSKECSRNTENLKATCSFEEPDCDKSCEDKAAVKDPANDNYCEKTAASCICICCFQYCAPVNTITEYSFNCSISPNSAPVFILDHIRDPHIGAPWQPPDHV